MILVTERPGAQLSKTKASDGSFQFSGNRVFDVGPGEPGPLSLTAALAALLDQKAVDFDHFYDDDNSDATVRTISQSYNATADMWVFTATYADVAGGEAFLSTPARVKYDPISIMYPVDYSPVNLIPFVNTVGTPFSDTLTDEKTGVVITVIVPRRGFNYATLLPYANKLNATPLNLPDGTVIPARQAKFLLPPIEDRVATFEDFFLHLRFEVRPGPRPGTSGHDRHVIDQGGQAYGEINGGSDAPVLGPILNGTNGASYAGNVLLDGAGRPIKESFDHVADMMGVPYELIDPPSPSPSISLVSPPISDGGLSSYDSEAHTGAVVLTFPIYFDAELNDLI